MAYSFAKDSPSFRLWPASRAAAIVDTTITTADSRAMRRSRGVKPFGFFILERQSATIRVSNPNGIAAGKSSCVCAADRRNRSIFGSTLFITFLFFTQIGVTKFGPHFLRLDLIETGVNGDARNPVLERHLVRKLRQVLKNFDENHLGKVLLSRSARAMRAHQFRHERIKLPDQCPSRLIIMLERSFNQRACIRLIHVVKSASTPLSLTGAGGLRLQFLPVESRKQNVTGEIPLRSLATEAQEALSKITN